MGGGFAILLFVVLLAPWLFGSVQVWAQLICLAGALLGASFSLTLPTWRQLPVNNILLLAVVILAAVQLIVMPLYWQRIIIPAATSLRDFFGVLSDRSRPISVDPASTRAAMGTLLGAILVYLVSSRCMANRMLRWIFLAIAINGACLALMGIWQQQFRDDLIYGVIKSASSPFGPFVNRNNAAGFLLSSLASAIGLLLLSLGSQSEPSLSGTRYALPLDIKLLSGWSFASLILSLVIVTGILFSQSRGGMFSLVIGATCTAILVVKRRQISGATAVVILGAGCVMILTLCSDMWLPISMRVSSLVDETQLASDARINIWASSISLIQDFWLTGSGLGTFGKIFRIYDCAPDGLIATHAENVYLQIACEGGLVMTFLILVIVAVFFRTAVYMVPQRHPISFCGGVMAIFLLTSQCLAGCFDYGLFIPANLYQMSLLLGVFAGLAVQAKSSEYSYKSKVMSRSSAGRQPKSARLSVLQRAADFRFEILLVGLICLGCFSVPDLIRASSLETVPPGNKQERVWNAIDDTSKPLDSDSEHDRLERNLPYRFDDSAAHYALAESFIRRFEDAIDKYESLNSTSRIQLHEFSRRLNEMAESKPIEMQRVLALPVVTENLVPALKHLRNSCDACCLTPNVHLRLSHLSFLHGGDGNEDLDRMVRLVEGSRYRLFSEGLTHYERGDYEKAFVSWKPCLESKSAYRTQIIQYATKVATLDQLLDMLFPKSDWFLLELANKHLLDPEQREFRERVLELARSKSG